MDYDIIDDYLRATLTEADDLPAEDQTNVLDLINASETALAFEIMCEQLYEYDVGLSRSTILSLAEAGKFMHQKEHLWLDLRIVEGADES